MLTYFVFGASVFLVGTNAVTLAGGRVYAGSAGDDGVFGGSALVVGSEENEKSSTENEKSSAENDKCKCLNWKETYASGAAECGAGNEFFYLEDKFGPAAGKAITPQLQQEFCDNFYLKIDDNFCTNVRMGADNGQWCYVDPSCPGAQASKGTSTALWKECGANDKRLRAYSPKQLESLAASAHLDFGLLHKMSYPLDKALWKQVKDFWNVTEMDLKIMPQFLKDTYQAKDEDLKVWRKWLKDKFRGRNVQGEWFKLSNMGKKLTQQMEEVKKAGTPYSFDVDSDHHPPHIIVQGDAVSMVMGSELICLKGC